MLPHPYARIHEIGRDRATHHTLEGGKGVLLEGIVRLRLCSQLLPGDLNCTESRSLANSGMARPSSNRRLTLACAVEGCAYGLYSGILTSAALGMTH